MTIDQRVLQMKKYFPRQQAAAFLAALISGLLIHLYSFTNLIPNADGLSRVFDAQQMTVSGRWFLHFASYLNRFTQMPMAIGLTSLFLIAAAAVFTVKTLEIKSSFLSALIGISMAAFPALGYTYLYMFTAAAYSLAILMAVVSIWLIKRYRFGWCFGILLLAAAMGIYQAYAAVAIALALLLLLRRALRPDFTFKRFLLQGLKLMGCIAAGAALYYGILMIFLKVKDLQLLSYLGIDAVVSGYPIGQLPALILNAYRQFFASLFLAGSADSFCTIGLALLSSAALAMLLISLIAALWKKEISRALASGAMLLLLPLGANFGQIISPYSDPTPIMKYAFVFFFIALFLLIDAAEDRFCSLLQRLKLPLLSLWAAGMMLFCLNTNNLIYTASAQAHRATESYLTRLLARIEAHPDYQAGMEILIIGRIPPAQIKASIESYEQIDHYSVPINNVATNNKHIYYYLNHWLNTPIEEPAEETLIAAAQGAEFKEMPLYPAPDSIRAIDGRLVIKLAEEYTPKQPYEIAYENRR